MRRLLIFVPLVAALAIPATAPSAIGRRSGDSSSDRERLGLVGALRLSGPGGISRLSTLGSDAFIGTHSSGCPLSGVHIVDFRDPSAPREVATAIAYPNTTAVDPEAIQIGGRAILAVGLAPCGLIPGRAGLELYDVSDAAAPRLLAFLPTARGIVGMDVTLTPDGRTLALLAVPGLEASSLAPPRMGDLLIVDISDPERPAQVGEWGMLDEPLLGSPILLGDAPDSNAINVNANRNGRRAYVSYGDVGTVILDITDPTAPRYLGRTAFGSDDEGNAHGAADARGGRLLIETTLDEQPFHIEFTSSAFTGARPALEAGFTPRVFALPGHALAGQVVYVGRGCPAGTVTPVSAEDPYLADPAGKIALLERGGCSFGVKVARAQTAGAIGAIVYNSLPGDAPLGMAGVNPVPLPDGTRVSLAIPAIGVSLPTGLLLRDAAPPVAARIEAVFNGWGFTRFYDISDPTQPIELAIFKTADSTDPEAALRGTWTPSDVAIRGNRAFIAWRNDGVVVVDISQPSEPRQIGAWNGTGAPDDAPPVAALGIAFTDNLVLVADRNFGLYILTPTP
jgi:hypothetical protein